MGDGAVLKVLTADGQGARIPVREPLIVGRAEGSGLRFADDRCVSPTHARFLVEEGRLIVEDMGAVNGVYVRVTEPTPLENRDRIRIGEHVFSFELIPDLEATRSNITRVFTDPTTEVIGSRGERARARLVMHLQSGYRGKEYFLGERAIVLGRGMGSHNFMSDEWISPRHAKIAPQSGGGFVLTDLGSEYGTWRQTRERVALHTGQEVLIGRQRLLVEAL